MAPAPGPPPTRAVTGAITEPAGPDTLPPLPYTPRPGQNELVRAALDTFQAGGQALLEAGTGTGKTVAVLAAALRSAEATGRKIVWLTRTNTQQAQVVREFRALTKDRQGQRPLALALQGRAHLCPELRSDARYVGANAEEYARLCGGLKRKTLEAMGVQSAEEWWGRQDDRDILGGLQADPDEDAGRPTPKDDRFRLPLPVTADSAAGCSYFQGLLQTDLDTLHDTLTQDPVPSERLAERLTAAHVCPYEAVKALLRRADLVVAPYIYLADPALGRALSDWIGVPLSECLVVVDEAHNLPDYLRGLLSPELTLHSLERARAEADGLGDPPLASGIRATRLIDTLVAAMATLAKERIPEGEDEWLLADDDLTTELLAPLRTNTPTLLRAADILLETGESLRRRLAQQGRLPRSYLGALGAFLAAWFRHDSETHVPIITTKDGPMLVLFCLDPAQGTGFLRDAHAAVHISGTLRPFDQHRDLLGLGRDTRTLHLPSPFAKDRLRLVLVDDITTRYAARTSDPEVMDRLIGHVESFLSVGGLNSAVFFPSHAMLENALELGIDTTPDRPLFVEEKGMDQDALVRAVTRFRALGDATEEGGSGAAVVGVMGGRLAEGIDFPGRALQAAALVGVPYPRPTARQRALVRFADLRFGRGWDYAVEAPTFRRVLQTIGRVIRDAKDEGIVFLLDERYRRYAGGLERLERLGDDETIAELMTEWLGRPEA
ncbi:MAG: ATP-dependent DNA helicase [Euryarchaeota archaeon]|nr:ATP-dependent DNA helicase [Euryarchaeota archaeon]